MIDDKTTIYPMCSLYVDSYIQKIKMKQNVFGNQHAQMFEEDKTKL